MKRQIDAEIQKKNYEKELLLCKKAGGDIERYRRLSFNALQLEQIRKGLESKVDVELFMDPAKNWLEMELIRTSLEAGIDIEKYIEQGFSWLQCQEIVKGVEEKLDVKKYLNVHFLAPQMKEIRKGLERGVSVDIYCDNRYDWYQMREIRKGLESKMDVSCYADPSYKYTTMRAVRKGMEEGISLAPFAKQGYAGKLLFEIGRGIRMNHDITPYLKDGYDEEQLKEINDAFEAGVNLLPYIRKNFHGVQLHEIILGLQKNLNVAVYADPELNWFQMREIRYGLEQGLDVKVYAKPCFSQKQMEILRKGLLEGIDVTEFAKEYFEPEQMLEKIEKIHQSELLLDDEVGKFLSETKAEEVEQEEEVPEKQEDDYLLESCVFVSEDKMQASINFSLACDVLKEELLKMDVSDVLKLLKHKDVKQGILRESIVTMLREKQFAKEVVVAKGKEPIDGEDAHFCYYFKKEVNPKPKVLADGTVDYKNMELFEFIKKDTLVAEYFPATAGTFGYDVTGQMISPKHGKELPALRVIGVRVSEDKKKYYADVDGIIEWHEGENKLEIRNLYTVPGNVDAATGNIRFNGDVNIMGNVTSGFSVQAAGNIVIDGHCEASQIEAGGDVIIRKGCQGKGLGKITAGKSIVGQFFESSVLTAGKDVQATYLLNCELKAKGKLLVEGRKGVIIGGKTCAKLGVSCNGIGNIAEIATVVSVGIDKEDMTAYQELQKKIEQTQAELQTCENGLNKLMANSVHDEKVSMMIQRLTRAVYTLKSSRKELFSERNAQMEQMTKQKEARIQVSGRAYPGTLLFLNEDPFAIKEIYSNVEFVKHDNHIDTLAH